MKLFSEYPFALVTLVTVGVFEGERSGLLWSCLWKSVFSLFEGEKEEGGASSEFLLMSSGRFVLLSEALRARAKREGMTMAGCQPEESGNCSDVNLLGEDGTARVQKKRDNDVSALSHERRPRLTLKVAIFSSSNCE